MSGRIIRALRVNCGLTQTAFADRLKIGKSTVSEIEKGRRPVSEDLRLKITKTFGSEAIAEAAELARENDALSL